MNNTAYIFKNFVNINEGITTGTITNAAMFFTKEYFYVIPLDAFGSTGMTVTQTDYTNTEEFISYITQNIDNLSQFELHKIMVDFLPPNRIHKIVTLDKFSIKTGWLTGGIRYKQIGENLKIVNIQPKKIRVKLKEFYNV
jgi:hypothetical protein